METKWENVGVDLQRLGQQDQVHPPCPDWRHFPTFLGSGPPLPVPISVSMAELYSQLFTYETHMVLQRASEDPRSTYPIEVVVVPIAVTEVVVVPIAVMEVDVVVGVDVVVVAGTASPTIVLLVASAILVDRTTTTTLPTLNVKSTRKSITPLISAGINSMKNMCLRTGTLLLQHTPSTTTTGTPIWVPPIISQDS
jgi:hypothetical protein